MYNITCCITSVFSITVLIKFSSVDDDDVVAQLAFPLVLQEEVDTSSVINESIPVVFDDAWLLFIAFLFLLLLLLRGCR
jgi:hypothetical protein